MDQDLCNQVTGRVGEVFGVIEDQEGLTTGEDVAKRCFE